MIGLMLKDIMPQKKVYLLVFMIAIITFPVSSNYPLMPGLDMRFGPILVLFILGFLICFSGFMIDEREKADVIVNSIAIPREKIVVARYLLSIITLAIFTIVGIGAELLVELTIHIDADGKIFYYLLGYSMGMLFVFIAYPFYYLLGSTNGQRVSFFLYFAISFGLPYLCTKLLPFETMALGKKISMDVSSFSNMVFLSYAVVVIVGIVSVGLSIMAYRKREF